MTPAVWEEIWQRTEDGESIMQIARALGVGRNTVTNCRKRQGAPPAYAAWDTCSDAEVLRKLTALVDRLERE